MQGCEPAEEAIRNSAEEGVGSEGELRRLHQCAVQRSQEPQALQVQADQSLLLSGNERQGLQSHVPLCYVSQGLYFCIQTNLCQG